MPLQCPTCSASTFAFSHEAEGDYVYICTECGAFLLSPRRLEPTAFPFLKPNKLVSVYLTEEVRDELRQRIATKHRSRFINDVVAAALKLLR